MSSHPTSQVALVVKNPAANAGDIRDVDEEGTATHSHLKNPMDRGGWWATVPKIA